LQSIYPHINEINKLLQYKQMKKQNLWMLFLVRWFVSSLGLWIAAAFLGSDRLTVGGRWGAWIAAGFVLAIINMLIKPLLIFLSLPALLLTLGLFMLVVNGFLILLASWIYDPLQVNGFGTAVIAGVIVGLVNWLVSHILEDFSQK
jgi:putative membrane protein